MDSRKLTFIKKATLIFVIAVIAVALAITGAGFGKGADTAKAEEVGYSPAEYTSSGSLLELWEEFWNHGEWDGIRVPQGNYAIATAADFRAFADITAHQSVAGSVFYLAPVEGNVLDLEGYEIQQIGTSNYPFAGIFDGRGMTIANYSGATLFGKIAEDGEVKNFTLKDFEVNGYAALALENYGLIERVAVIDGTVTFGYNASGLVAILEGVLQNCYVMNVVLDSFEEDYTVAFVDVATQPIHSCYAVGVVKADGEDVDSWGASGCIGAQLNSTNVYVVSDTYSNNRGMSIDEAKTGKLAAALGDAFGQAIGTEDYPSFLLRSQVETHRVFTVEFGVDNSDGIEVYQNKGSLQVDKLAYSVADVDFVDYAVTLEGEPFAMDTVIESDMALKLSYYIDFSAYGEGTSENPFAITDEEALIQLEYSTISSIPLLNSEGVYFDGRYPAVRLDSDITFNNDFVNDEVLGDVIAITHNARKYLYDYTNDVWYNATNRVEIDSMTNEELIESLMGKFDEWKPIAFMGEFDGNGHKITNLYINSDAERIGFFGIFAGILKNLTVEGFVKGGEMVGGVAGGYMSFGNEVSMVNVVNKATVIGNAVVGGIVGAYVFGMDDMDSTMMNCVNYGNVFSNEGFVGGLAGMAMDVSSTAASAEIINCLNYGNVSLASGNVNEDDVNYAGGLVGGAAKTTVINSVSLGQVAAPAYGRLIGNAVLNTSAKNCYYVGEIDDMPFGNSNTVKGTYTISYQDTEFVLAEEMVVENVLTTDLLTALRAVQNGISGASPWYYDEDGRLGIATPDMCQTITYVLTPEGGTEAVSITVLAYNEALVPTLSNTEYLSTMAVAYWNLSSDALITAEDNITVGSEIAVTGDITLYAVLGERVTISFYDYTHNLASEADDLDNPNSGRFETISISPYGACMITLPTEPQYHKLSYTGTDVRNPFGTDFVGWNTNVEATADDPSNLAPGSTILWEYDNDTILYAIWENKHFELGTGTSDDPFWVSTVEELNSIRPTPYFDLSGVYYSIVDPISINESDTIEINGKLTFVIMVNYNDANYYFDGTKWYSEVEGETVTYTVVSDTTTTTALLALVNRFEPIGLNVEGRDGDFGGNIEGNDNFIEGIYINTNEVLWATAGDRSSLGFIRSNVGGNEIKNLTLQGFVICNQALTIGGFIGEDKGLLGDTTIANCINEITVIGSGSANQAGGFVGLVSGENTINISGLNLVAVSSKNNAGGFIGSVSGTATINITEGSNYAEITTSENKAGGFIGSVSEAATVSIGIEGSFGNTNEGKITGVRYVGGFIGSVSGAGTITIIGCENKADIHASGGGSAGFIGSVSEAATITLGTESIGNVNNGKITAGGNAGGFVGYNTNASITIIGGENNGTVSISNTGTNAAGFVARLNSGTLVFENCTNNGNVTGNDGCDIGGFVGYATGTDPSISISNSYNSGNITSGVSMVDNSAPNAGGFIAHPDSSTMTISITNSVNSGEIKAGWNSAGFVGKNDFAAISISGCTNEGAISLSKTGTNAGGFVARQEAGSLTIVDSTNCASVTGNNGCDVGGFVGFVRSELTLSISGSTNTEEGVISTGAGSGETTATAGGFIGHIKIFAVTVDIIDCNNYGNVTGKNISDVGGFVGNNESTAIVTISGTVSEATEEGTGEGEGNGEGTGAEEGTGEPIITYTTNSGAITAGTGFATAGGFIGNSKSGLNIAYGINTGSVTGSSTSAAVGVGGFVGRIITASGLAVTITDSTNEGAVSTGKNAGGFVGKNDYSALTISDSTNEGDVKVTDVTTNVAGFVARSDGGSLTILDCRNTGSVSTPVKTASAKIPYSVGGFGGAILNTTLTISDSTNEGAITSYCGTNVDSSEIGSGAGGFVGRTHTVSVLITDSTNKGKVTAMKMSAGFIGFVQKSDLTISDSINEGEISLTTMGTNMGGFFASMDACTDISITDCSNKGSITAATAGGASVGGFIGAIYDDKNVTSTLTITNCYNEAAIYTQNNSSGVAGAGGFIGRTYNSNMTVTITGGKNTGDVTSQRTAAGIIGKHQTGKLIISGITNEGAILSTLGTSAMGAGTAGIVAVIHDAISVSITDSYNKGTVTTTTAGIFPAGGFVGSIVGSTKTVEITSCNNEGNITSANNSGADYAGTGGFIGYAKDTGLTVTITNCKNIGNVSSLVLAGGFVGRKCYGYMYFIECTNEGTVEVTNASSDVGGFMAKHDNGVLSFTGCTNTGDITARNIGSCAAGFVAALDGASTITITGSKNTGEITSSVSEDKTTSSGEGGLFGRISHAEIKVTIKNCSNEGDVTAPLAAGGLVGMLNFAATVTIEDSKNFGNILSKLGYNEGDALYSASGGFVGYSVGSVTIKGSENHGSVTSQTATNSSSGGFVASSIKSVTITDSTNYGIITIQQENAAAEEQGTTKGTDPSGGGFVGINNTGLVSISNSVNEGAVIDASDGSELRAVVGGFVGRQVGSGNTLTIKGCINKGAITATGIGADAGGLVGNIGYGTTTITESINRGEVKQIGGHGASWAGLAGGIIADTINSPVVTITDVANYGNITGAALVGGIIGKSATKTLTMRNIINYGDVKAIGDPVKTTFYIEAGGIIAVMRGAQTTTVSNAVNVGDVSALTELERTSVHAGGLVAVAENAAIKVTFDNVANFGIVTNQAIEDDVAELIQYKGGNATVTITNGYAATDKYIDYGTLAVGSRCYVFTAEYLENTVELLGCTVTVGEEVVDMLSLVNQVAYANSNYKVWNILDGEIVFVDKTAILYYDIDNQRKITVTGGNITIDNSKYPKEGYKLVGWSTKQDPGVADKEFEATGFVAEANTIYYAVYEAIIFDGEGTKENPYIIDTMDDLMKLSEAVNIGAMEKGAYYKQTSDILLSKLNIVCIDGVLYLTIELEGVSYYTQFFGMPIYKYVGNVLTTVVNDTEIDAVESALANVGEETVAMTPIGTSSFPFVGVYDGGGYTISGLALFLENYCNYGGLFGYAHSSVFKNINIKSAVIGGEYDQLGVLVGHAGGSEIAGCTVSNVMAVDLYAEYFGGIVGAAYGVDIRNSSVSNLIFDGDSDESVGGMVGNGESITIISCNVENIDIDTNAWEVGGILAYIGRHSEANIFGSTVKGLKVYGNSRSVGGLVGSASNASLTIDASSASELTFASDTYTIYSNFGGLVGNIAMVGRHHITNSSADIRVYSSYSKVGGIIGNIERDSSDDTHIFIENSYAIVEVINDEKRSEPNLTAGGLLGSYDALTMVVKNSYASSTFFEDTAFADKSYGGSTLGGLAGSMTGDDPSSYSIFENCYAMSNIPGTYFDCTTDRIHELYGHRNEYAEFSNCYSFAEKSGVAGGYAISNGASLLNTLYFNALENMEYKLWKKGENGSTPTLGEPDSLLSFVDFNGNPIDKFSGSDGKVFISGQGMIFYTTDGSIPTLASSVYSVSGIEVENGTTINAIVLDNYGAMLSTMISVTFVKPVVVAFDSSTVTGGMVPDSATYAVGDVVELPRISEISSADGEKLIGWTTSTDGTDLVGTFFYAITGKDEGKTITFYPVWGNESNISVWDGVTATDSESLIFDEEEDKLTYQIYSAANLVGVLTNFLSDRQDYKTIHLSFNVDIDLAGYDWTPINTSWKVVILGNGHSIYNLYVPEGYAFGGLFGDVYSLTVDSLNIIGGEVYGSKAAGALAGAFATGEMYNLTIQNASIYGGPTASIGIISGIVGYQRFGFANSAVIGGKLYGGYVAGGLIGTAVGRLNIFNSYVVADFDGSALSGLFFGNGEYLQIMGGYAVGDLPFVGKGGTDNAQFDIKLTIDEDGYLLEESVYELDDLFEVLSLCARLLNDGIGNGVVMTWTMSVGGLPVVNQSLLVRDVMDEDTYNDPDTFETNEAFEWYYSNPEQEIFEIYTAEEFAAFGALSNTLGIDFLGKTIMLMADIDIADFNVGPIGQSNGEAGRFRGLFDGNDYTISGIKNALFGTIAEEGTVQDLTVYGLIQEIKYEADSTGDLASAAIALYLRGKILGCVSYVNISNIIYGDDSFDIGGIAATASGTILESINYGDISITNADVMTLSIGGIVGDAYGAVIEECENYGNVTGEYAETIEIGGIVGTSYENDYTDCKNYGIITATDANVIKIGGIAGESYDDIILGCENHGVVTAGAAETTYIGGIAGYVNWGAVINCANYGKLSGEDSTVLIGGITGALYGDIESSVNYGDITVTDSYTVLAGGMAGFFVGSSDGALYNSYNVGDINVGTVENYARIGGLVGDGIYSGIYNSANIGNVSYTGTDTGNILVGGILGGDSGSGARIINSVSFGKSTGGDLFGSANGVNVARAGALEGSGTHDRGFVFVADAAVGGYTITNGLDGLNGIALLYYLNSVATRSDVYMGWKVVDGGLAPIAEFETYDVTVELSRMHIVNGEVGQDCANTLNPYIVSFEGSTGHGFSSTIGVYVGANELTADNYTWENGILVINADAITDNIKIVASGVLKEYSITTESTINGTVSVSATSGKHFDEVTVSYLADLGYELSTIEMKIGSSEGWNPVSADDEGKYSFVLSGETSVRAIFQKVQYTLSVYENGSEEATPYQYTMGEEIVFSADEKVISSLYYTYNGVTHYIFGQGVSGEDYALIMPAANVTVYLSYEAKAYDISVAEVNITNENSLEEPNGISTVSVTSSAKVGDTVSINAEIAKGYSLVSIVVAGETFSTTLTDDTDFEFTMPAEAVTVTMTVQVVAYTIMVASTPIDWTDDSYEAFADAYSYNQEVIFEVKDPTIADTYRVFLMADDSLIIELKAIAYVDGDTSTKFVFNMPAASTGARLLVTEKAVESSPIPIEFADSDNSIMVADFSLGEGHGYDIIFELTSSVTTILITAVPDGYTIDTFELTYTPVDGEAVTVSLDYDDVENQAIYTFSDAELARTGGTYTISTTRSAELTLMSVVGEGGTYTVNDGTNDIATGLVKAGTSLTITPTPAEGYSIISVEYLTDGVWTTLTDSGSGYSFDMPAKATDIRVVLEKVYYSIAIQREGIDGSGIIEAAKLSAIAGETVEFTAKASSGYSLEAVAVLEALSALAVEHSYDEANGTYSFVMPEADVIISASFVLGVYDIVIDGESSGDFLVTTDTEATEGESITGASYENQVFILIAKGYRADITVTSEAGNIEVVRNSLGQYYFMMPNESVTLKAVVTIIDYTVSGVASESVGYSFYKFVDGEWLSMGENRTINVGDRIRVEYAIATGYAYTGATVSYCEGNVTKDTAYCEFVAADGNAVVSVTCSQIQYTLRVSSRNNVYAITANGTTYTYGQYVALTVDIKQGYRLNGLYRVSGGDRALIELSSNGVYSFTMPAGDTTIDVDVEAILYTITLDSNEGKAMKSITYKIGDTVKLYPTYRNGYVFESWEVVEYPDNTSDIGTKYLALSEISGKTGDMTLRANWFSCDHSQDSLEGEPNVVAPTCTTMGYTERECSVCSAKYQLSSEPMLEHNIETVVKEPACEERGNTSYVCTICGEAKVEYIDALNHDFASIYTEDVKPGCNTPGSESRHCSRCDARTDVRAISALNHKFADEFTTDIEATCTTEGSKSKHCSRCEEVSDVETIPVKHEYASTYTIDVEPGCTTQGSESRHCTLCDARTDERAISQLNHDFAQEFTTDLEATCTTDGSQSRHCSRCDEVTEVKVIAASGHNFVFTETVLPNVDEKTDGYDLYTCVHNDAIEHRNTVRYETLIPPVVITNVDSVELDDYVLGTTLPEPELPGYVFEGWYTDATYQGEPITSIDELDDDVVLYARWAVEVQPKVGVDGGAVAGIVIGCIVFVLVAAFVALYFIEKKKGPVLTKAFEAVDVAADKIAKKTNELVKATKDKINAQKKARSHAKANTQAEATTDSEGEKPAETEEPKDDSSDDKKD